MFLSRVIGQVVDRVVFRTENGHGPAFFITLIVAELGAGHPRVHHCVVVLPPAGVSRRSGRRGARRPTPHDRCSPSPGVAAAGALAGQNGCFWDFGGLRRKADAPVQNPIRRWSGVSRHCKVQIRGARTENANQ